MINQEQIQQIGDYIELQAALSESLVNELRQRHDKIHFTFCSEDDVAEQSKPVYQNSAFNLYLIDSRNHCLCFTQDTEIATGVVVAEIEDDDEL